MVCLACRGPGPALCAPCRRTLQPSGELKTPAGLVVRPWARHEGPARVLVRRLKYEGVEAVARLVASEMTDAIPDGVQCLVPVVRTPVRRLRYGIDPAMSIARALSVRTGIPQSRGSSAVAPPERWRWQGETASSEPAIADGSGRCPARRRRRDHRCDPRRGRGVGGSCGACPHGHGSPLSD